MVTYSPEDDKLRLYVGRVPRDEYETLRRAGFVSTPKQDCDFVAVWTPQREDLARGYLDDGDDIGDEGQSLADRAADRAERFAGYREKRAGEAHGLADRAEASPSVVGHQSRDRAERLARRIERTQGRAVGQWSKAEYWRDRTAGVISNALHRLDARTRRGRIDTIETELRRLGPVADGEESHRARWAAHMALRLEYENAMLAAEGGRAGEADMVPGGFFRGAQVVRVHKSTANGRVTSVTVLIDGTERHCDVTRAPADAYRGPTEREAAEFAVAEKARKKAKAAASPKAPPIINPTAEDAAKLQEYFNDANARRRKDGRNSHPFELTQALYSLRSKPGGSCEMLTVTELVDPYDGMTFRGRKGRREIFRVRVSSGGQFGYARRVVVITDKPTQSIPWAAVETARAALPTPAKLAPRAAELAAVLALPYQPDKGDERHTLLHDAEYCGLAWVSSLSQFGFTEAGREWYAKLTAPPAATAPAARPTCSRCSDRARVVVETKAHGIESVCKICASVLYDDGQVIEPLTVARPSGPALPLFDHQEAA